MKKGLIILLLVLMSSAAMGMENEQKSGEKITIQATKEDWERLKALVSELEKVPDRLELCLAGKKSEIKKEELKKNDENNEG